MVTAGLAGSTVTRYSGIVTSSISPPRVDTEPCRRGPSMRTRGPACSASSRVCGRVAPGPPATTGGPGATLPQTREAALQSSPRVRIEGPRLHGSISTRGALIDDVTMPEYRVTVDPGSPAVTILSPPGTESAYYAEFGWAPATPDVAVPGADTVWTASGGPMAPDRPVTLSWDNGQGLVFERKLEIDRDYMLTITQSVRNESGAAVTLHPYGLISRTGKPKTQGFYVLHEGPVGVLGGTLKEHGYDDLTEKPIEAASTGGWLGFTDKYWLVALIPDQQAESKTKFSHATRDGKDRYQADYLRPGLTVAPGETKQVTDRLFAGAKETLLLDRYEKDLGIARFDLAVDWGWFYFLTKPIFYALHWLRGVVGNFGIAILMLTVVIKGLFFPLANKSYRAMSGMKKLQPEMLKLRERFGDDKQRMNQELMALYKKEKINPAAGCLPIVIQIPVFFALYKVLVISIEMRHAPFYGWIADLSAPDPTNIFNLFGLIPFDPPHFLHLGVWPLLMGVTMFLQMKLNPQPADPVQAKVFMLMPIIFTVMLAGFPAGLVIYWAWNNLLSIAQQWLIMRRNNAGETKGASATPTK